MPQEPYRFNVGASPRLKSQLEFTQPISTVADILPALSKQLRLDEKAKEISVLGLANHFLQNGFDGRFSQAVSASHIQNKRNKKVLIVKVRNGIVASELGFHTKALLDQVNQYSQQTEIRIDRVELKITQL